MASGWLHPESGIGSHFLLLLMGLLHEARSRKVGDGRLPSLKPRDPREKRSFPYQHQTRKD